MSDTTEVTSAGLFRDGAELTRTDSKGRKLVIKQLSLREEMDLLAAAGGERADNRRWMMYATLVSCVRRIDGVPTPRPTRIGFLETNIDRVGAEGVAVVAQVLAEEAASEPDGDDADHQNDPAAETVAIAKN